MIYYRKSPLLELLRGDSYSTDKMWDAEVRSVEEFIPQDQQGLDIGCGGRTISRSNWTADLAPATKPRHKVLAPGWKILDFEEGIFDWVYSGHFLEHMLYPHLVLQELLRCVKPGGYVATVVPDVRFTAAQNTDPTPHYHEWSPEDLLQQIFGQSVDHHVPYYKLRFDVPEMGARLVHIGPACLCWSFAFVLQKHGEEFGDVRETGEGMDGGD